MTSGSDRGVQYNAANKPTHIQTPATGTPSSSVDFVYGADGNRVFQIALGGGETAWTTCVGLGGTGKSLYERTVKGTKTEHVHFIYAGSTHGGSAFALRVVSKVGTSLPVTGTKYQHFDHLGSVTAISDETGHVVNSPTGGSPDPNASVLGYDAWGARRNPTGKYATPSSFTPQTGHREFTGHEAIPGLGLVNMNGRVYDPVLGRFLSPDPSVQFAADLQSYNRSSYVLNNPLRYTDPTGYAVFGSGWVDTLVGVGIGLAATVGCAATGGAGCAAFFMITGAILSSTSALSSGATYSQVGLSLAIGAAGGAFGGAIGGAVVGEVAENVGAAVLGGMIGGAVANVITTVGTGGDLSAANILTSAAIGGATAAAAWAMTPHNSVTEASRKEAEGGGETNGAREVEMELHKPKDDQIVQCGQGGMPKCGTLGKLDDLDRLAINRAEEVRGATLKEPQHEYGIGFKENKAGTVSAGQNKAGQVLQTSGKNELVNIKVQLEKGERFVGGIHGHPSGSGSEYFSGWDINHTPKGIRDYLVTPKGAVLRFDPSANEITIIRAAPVVPNISLPAKRDFLLP